VGPKPNRAHFGKIRDRHRAKIENLHFVAGSATCDGRYAPAELKWVGSAKTERRKMRKIFEKWLKRGLDALLTLWEPPGGVLGFIRDALTLLVWRGDFSRFARFW
jgi:hypothetical protein